jgi:hypothetical protein
MPLFLSYRNSFEFKYIPMHESYDELIVGIPSVHWQWFLSKSNHVADVGSLKVGINGDYTVKSSDDLYTNMAMQEKLLHATRRNH